MGNERHHDEGHEGAYSCSAFLTELGKYVSQSPGIALGIRTHNLVVRIRYSLCYVLVIHAFLSVLFPPLRTTQVVVRLLVLAGLRHDALLFLGDGLAPALRHLRRLLFLDPW